MSKFILIDHSLCGVGGHHFEYATHLLREADSAGYEIVLATNRQFKDHAEVPSHWKILPVFQYTTYTKYAIICSLNSKRDKSVVNQANDLFENRKLPPIWNPAGWIGRAAELKNQSRRRRRTKSFAAACRRLFSHVETKPGDIVMVPTLSELDLSGLAEFLASTPETRELTWHLQFHFDFIGGREKSADRQRGRYVEIRRRFADEFVKIPRHQIILHCTTDILAAQYQHLDVGEFRELPYPIDPSFHAPDRPRKANRPLKITCAGGLRNEKGHQNLSAVIKKVWHSIFVSRRAQLQIQARPDQFRKLVSEIHNTKKPFHSTKTTKSSSESLIVRFEHPLEHDEYLNLIHDSDMGIFLYDGDSYYTRCSGILAEMLAAGSPVIVPAGCWLADQIAEPSFRHLDNIFDDLSQRSIKSASDLNWSETTAHDGTLSFGESPNGLAGEIDIDPKCESLMIRFKYGVQPELGTYVRINAQQLDQNGRVVEDFITIIGRRSSRREVSSILPLNKNATRLRLIWNNAYHHDEISVTDVKLAFVPSDSRGGRRRIPLSAVGLVASSYDQFPILLEEMVDHFQHYRQTANDYSREWIQKHLPSNTFATLISRDYEISSDERSSRAA